MQPRRHIIVDTASGFMVEDDTDDVATSSEGENAETPAPDSRLDSDILEADVLMTGFPGFIAGRLLEETLAWKPSGDFYFLIEPRYRRKAERRLREIARDVPNFDDERWELIEGDITDEYMGLDHDQYRDLAERVGVVWHLAALYDLAVPEAVAYRVNVKGTVHVLDFCEACDELERFNYVSTCYVSGERRGIVYEDELHKNHYESTKFWAEVEVQRRWMNLPTAIFRPGIVVGDSRTGETDKYDGPYYLFKFLKKLPDWVPVPNIGEGDALVNIVPVDFVTRAMAFLGCAESTDGDVYQLADPHPMRARNIFALALDCMGKPSSIGSVPASLADVALRSNTVAETIGMPREVLDYFNHGARYDVSNTQRALTHTSIRCPHLSTYMQTLIDYFLRHPEGA